MRSIKPITNCLIQSACIQGYFILASQRINSLSHTLSPFKRTLHFSQEINFLVHWIYHEIALACITLSSSIFSISTIAQVTTDGTTATTVTSPDNNNFTINDGDRAGNNLFHSFQDFSVPTNGSASFNNAADIANIFSRVTGGNISNIDIVNLNQTPQGFIFNYEGVPNFGYIQLNQQAILNTTGFSGGTINIRGEQLSIQNGSQIVSLNQADIDGGDINFC